MKDPVVYRSHVRVERIKGPLRRAFLPGDASHTMFSVHDEVAEHYGVDNSVVERHATTLDHIVGAAAG